MISNVRNIKAFMLACLLALAFVVPPADSTHAETLDETLEKRLLFFTHYIATSAHTFTPENAPSIAPKILRFTVGSEKTSLRDFLDEHAGYIVREGLSGTFSPSVESFRATPLTGEATGFRTRLRGTRAMTLDFQGEEAYTKDILEVELDVTPTEITEENPFGLYLTRYGEQALE